jgi:hypothetical protein
MLEDRLAIAEVVQNWAIWRDAGDWERLRTAWHDDGWMSATWFQGPAAKFIEVSRAGALPSSPTCPSCAARKSSACTPRGRLGSEALI